MSDLHMSFKEYVQNFTPKFNNSDMATYRKLGNIDTYSENSFTRESRKRLLTLMEAWSLLRVENPSLSLAQMTPAGEFLDDYAVNIYPQSVKIRTSIEAFAIFGKADFPKTLSVPHRIYSTLTGQEEERVSFRQDDLWIGGQTRDDAKYRSPAPSEIPTRLQEVAQYIQEYTQAQVEVSEGTDIDPLSLLCAAHSYSFLLLPYEGENMKWTALWSLYLAKLLSIPEDLFLPLSYGIFSIRTSYSEGLLQSLESTPTLWMKIWKDIISESIKISQRIRQRSEVLASSLKAHQESFGKAKKHLKPLLLHLCSYPYVTLSDISDLTGLTKPNAALLIKKAESIGLLKAVTFEKRNRVYASEFIISTCEGSY